MLSRTPLRLCERCTRLVWDPYVTISDFGSKLGGGGGDPRGSVPTAAALRGQWAHAWTRLSIDEGGGDLPPALPEAYRLDSDAIVLSVGGVGEIARALQSSDLSPRVAGMAYPGPGRALLVLFARPFSAHHDVLLVHGGDNGGLQAGLSEVRRIAGV